MMEGSAGGSNQAISVPYDRETIEYELLVRQQPRQARMCGVGVAADRRPIDPPPIIQLKVRQRLGRGGPSTSTTQDPADSGYVNNYLQNPYYFMYASLAKESDDSEMHWLKDGKTCSTTGSVVSSLYHLKDSENQNEDAGFFVFPDLSVRTEGSYRLKLSLFEVVGSNVHHCKSIFSNAFYVYTAKKFPGMEESTPLSCSLAEQGIKIRIRKDIRVRKRPTAVTEETTSTLLLPTPDAGPTLPVPGPVVGTGFGFGAGPLPPPSNMPGMAPPPEPARVPDAPVTGRRARDASVSSSKRSSKRHRTDEDSVPDTASPPAPAVGPAPVAGQPGWNIDPALGGPTGGPPPTEYRGGYYPPPPQGYEPHPAQHQGGPPPHYPPTHPNAYGPTPPGYPPMGMPPYGPPMWGTGMPMYDYYGQPYQPHPYQHPPRTYEHAPPPASAHSSPPATGRSNEGYPPPPSSGGPGANPPMQQPHSPQQQQTPQSTTSAQAGYPAGPPPAGMSAPPAPVYGGYYESHPYAPPPGQRYEPYPPAGAPGYAPAPGAPGLPYPYPPPPGYYAYAPAPGYPPAPGGHPPHPAAYGTPYPGYGYPPAPEAWMGQQPPPPPGWQQPQPPGSGGSNGGGGGAGGSGSQDRRHEPTPAGDNSRGRWEGSRDQREQRGDHRHVIRLPPLTRRPEGDEGDRGEGRQMTPPHGQEGDVMENRRQSASGRSDLLRIGSIISDPK